MRIGTLIEKRKRVLMEAIMNEKKYSELEQKNQKARQKGGQKRLEAQNAKGKWSAQQRIDYLLDADSFVEYDKLTLHRCTNFGMEKNRILGDSVITGSGTIFGRLVYVFAQDFTVNGGSLSLVHAEKICKILDMAMSVKAPVIGLLDSGGARVQEGIDSLAGYGNIFVRNVMASGVIPQLSAILGPCAGGAVYSPAITDFIAINDKNSFMFVTGPKVVKTVLHEDISTADLGGADVHTSKSGVAHFHTDGEAETLDTLKTLISYIPSSYKEKPPVYQSVDSPLRDCPTLNEIIPENPNKPYNMHEVIGEIFDGGEFFEVAASFAPNIIVGFARLDGKTCGVVANQPAYLAGCLDINSSVKGARFVRFCDCFNIPLAVLEDVPGFMPGSVQEHGGIIRNGAKLMYAFSEATVPKVTIILRKAYGGAYIVMNSRHLFADIVAAWPTSEIAVMGAKGAVEIIFRREAMASDNPKQVLKKRQEEYSQKFENPYDAAAKGYIDSVIMPSETRKFLIQTFERLENKDRKIPQKKHGNIPL